MKTLIAILANYKTASVVETTERFLAIEDVDTKGSGIVAEFKGLFWAGIFDSTDDTWTLLAFESPELAIEYVTGGTERYSYDWPVIARANVRKLWDFFA